MGENVEFNARWERKVVEDHLWMSEYGLPFDLRSLPKKHFEAHIAILQGIARERSEQADEQEREAKKAKSQARRARGQPPQNSR